MKKKSVPPLVKHKEHNVVIQKVEKGHHVAQYYCLDCKLHVAWISQAHLRIAEILDMV